MIRINPDLGYLEVAQEQEQRIEKSRRLHCILADYDAELRELEADPVRYTVADYHERRQAIMRLREQTQKEIEELPR